MRCEPGILARVIRRNNLEKQESCMARRVVRMHNFVWVIALCAGIVFSALVLGHAHFNKSPRSTAVITHEDSLPPVW
jgi:hypothetical protein